MKLVRIFFYIILCIILIIGLTFAILNATPVKLNYYLNTTEIYLSLLLVYVLGIGILCGFIGTLPTILKLKKQNHALKNQIKKLEKERSVVL